MEQAKSARSVQFHPNRIVPGGGLDGKIQPVQRLNRERDSDKIL